MFGIAVPIAGNDTNTRDIEIRDNTFLTAPDDSCNTMIEVGAYPTSPNTFKNVVVAGNVFKQRQGPGVRFDHVVDGAIQNNRDDLTFRDVVAGRRRRRGSAGSRNRRT